MERRDFLLSDIEKIGVVVANLLRFKGRKKDEHEMLEIHNGLSELFHLDVCTQSAEALQTIINDIKEPEKLNYLIQLIELEMENSAWSSDELFFRQNLLRFVQKHLEAQYADLRIATFWGQQKLN